MPQPPPAKGKQDILRQHGALNHAPDSVTDRLFREQEFFDPRDLVQVKYEMLRRVRGDRGSITETAATFGFSRPSFYQAQAAFQQAGLLGLMPQKRGPRRAHKLTPEVMNLVEQARREQPSSTPKDLAKLVSKRLGLTVHPRSIHRRLLRNQKKTH
jgi:transposase